MLLPGHWWRMKINNLIDLNSYIRINSIRESFEAGCIFVSSLEEMRKIDIYNSKNIIFETSQLKNRFYESLILRDIDHTVINCLSSNELFDSMISQAKGIIVFDNVCSCKNNYILEQIEECKERKLLVC